MKMNHLSNSLKIGFKEVKEFNEEQMVHRGRENLRMVSRQRPQGSEDETRPKNLIEESIK